MENARRVTGVICEQTCHFLSKWFAHKIYSIHGSRTPTNSILACEGEKIEENDEQTECTAVDAIGNQTQVSTTEGKTKENFFKVNWRVLGGGVIIGNNGRCMITSTRLNINLSFYLPTDGNRRRHSLDKVSHGVYRKASVPFDIDSREFVQYSHSDIYSCGCRRRDVRILPVLSSRRLVLLQTH